MKKNQLAADEGEAAPPVGRKPDDGRKAGVFDHLTRAERQDKGERKPNQKKPPHHNH